MNGKRVFFLGTHDRRETRRMAEKLEDDNVQIKLGYKQPATSADKFKNRSFSEVIAEYIAWGESQGERRAVGPGRVNMRESGGMIFSGGRLG